MVFDPLSLLLGIPVVVRHVARLNIAVVVGTIAIPMCHNSRSLRPERTSDVVIAALVLIAVPSLVDERVVVDCRTANVDRVIGRSRRPNRKPGLFIDAN